MSQEDYNEDQRSKPYRNFRIVLDLGMGVLYLVMAAAVIYTKHFAALELSSGVVYGMGAILVLYGLFRIYRGIVDLRERNSTS